MSKNRMLINYEPGEECRIAIVRNGRLEEFYAERMDAASGVGNIALGRVTNVESSIQAAFVDYGHEQSGFLHITDLHPRYFPGGDDETTEKVGKKTPRRDRPPIQQALKRGQQVVVQVIKEGIGTKGPTLSTYLSIPGRFLVMMPDMDKVGVSRKVEDDDQRREMRKALDSLDLPEGFGFILRTAGMGRTKAELKRDLAYLQRLWRDMEKRRATGKAPRVLYAESDLLVRTLRDVLSGDIDEVVIDDESALKRAARFMKIVSPRASSSLLHYKDQTPLFHAFGIEEQIRRMHSREVPLPSGGRLVIDETEALVAIDVNSGKMRRHGDAETTAFKTNMEAADEICRQLKLRDLGGLVVLDMIDMRHRSHRATVEAKFRDLFKNDRARSKVLAISQLGLVELTRQRMRGSVLSTQYTPCPTCSGFGMVQRPGFVASDAMRELGSLLQAPNVHKVEMVVSPRVATELLTSRRRSLGRLELRTGKSVEVRVSETVPVDRVTYYAYDDRGADIAIDKLPKPKAPSDLEVWRAGEGEDWAVDPADEAQARAEEEAKALEAAVEADETDLEEPSSDFEKDVAAEDEGTDGEKPRKRRRRRGGRRRRKRKGDDASPEQRAEAGEAEQQRPGEKAKSGAAEEAGRGDADQSDPDQSETDDGDGEQRKGKRRRRRRRRGGRGKGGGDKSSAADNADASGDEDRPAEKKPDEAKAESKPKPKPKRGARAKPETKASDNGKPDKGESGARRVKRKPASDGVKVKATTPPAKPSTGVVRRAWGFGVVGDKPEKGALPRGAAPEAEAAAESASSEAPAKKKRTTRKAGGAKKTTTKKTTKKAASKKKTTTKKTSRKKSTTKRKKPSTKAMIMDAEPESAARDD